MPKTAAQVIAELEAKQKREAEAAANAVPEPRPVEPPPAEPKPAPKPAPSAPKPAPSAPKPAPSAPKTAGASVSETERMRAEADAALKKLTPEQRAALEPAKPAPPAAAPKAKKEPAKARDESLVGFLREGATPDDETMRSLRQGGATAALAAGRTGTAALAEAAALVTPGGATDEIRREQARTAVKETLNPAIDEQFVKTTKAVREEAEKAEQEKRDRGAWEYQPENQKILERAQRIQRTPDKDRQQKVRAFLSGRTQELLTEALRRAGGQDKVTSGPAYDKLEEEARREALADLLTLQQVGAWTSEVRPEDLDTAPADRWYIARLGEALLPQQKVFSQYGTYSRSEALPWWAVNMLVFSPTFVAQSVLDTASGDDFSEALIRNIAERRDPLTAYIEGNQQFQADVASGEPDRVAGALSDPTFVITAVATAVSPDAITAGTRTLRTAKAMTEVMQLATRAGEVGRAVKETGSVAKGVQQVREVIKAEEAAAKAAKEQARIVRHIETIERTYQQTGDIEATAQAIEDTTSALRRKTAGVVAPDEMVIAKALREEYFARLAQDEDVAAYLVQQRAESGKLTPDRFRPVPGVSEERKADALAELEKLLAERREIVKQMDADIVARVKREGPIPDDELRGIRQETTEVVNERIRRARERVAQMLLLEQARAGEAKFHAAMKQAGDDIVSEWGRIARGEEAPAAGAAAQAPAADAVGPRVDPADLARAFGKEVSPEVAARVAAANTPEEVVAALQRTPQEVKDAVARRLGAADFESLQKTLKGTDAEVATAQKLAQDYVVEARQKLLEAQDRYLALTTAPADAKRLADARKVLVEAEKELAVAEKELSAASAVNVSGRAKVRRLEGAAALREKELADLRDALAAEDAEKAGKTQAKIDLLQREIDDLRQALTLPVDEQKIANLKYWRDKIGEGVEVEVQRTLDGFKKGQTLLDKEKKLAFEEALLENLVVKDKVREKKVKEVEKLRAEVKKLQDKWLESRAVKEKSVRDFHAQAAERVEEIKRTSSQEYIEHTKQALAKKEAKLAAETTSARAAAAAREEKTAQRVQAAEDKATQARGAAQLAAAEQARAERAASDAYASAVARKEQAEQAHKDASAAYAAVPEPKAKLRSGVAGQEQLAKAQQSVLNATKTLAEREEAAKAVDRIPAERAALRQALADARPEYENLARALEQQAADVEAARQAVRTPRPPDAREFRIEEDFATLQRRFRGAERDVRRLSRNAVQVVAENAYSSIRELVLPYGVVEEQSLSPAFRQLARNMEGEFKDVEVALAHATDAVDPTSRAANTVAFNGVARDIPSFKEGIAAQQMSGEYVNLAATSYLNPDVVAALGPVNADALVQMVRDWAKDPSSDLLALREKLLAESERIAGGTSGIRPPQEGDLFLAQAIGYGGVEREAIRQVQLQNLAYGPEDARAVNNVLLGTSNPETATGGNAFAARGRELAARVLTDPENYARGRALTRSDSAVRSATTTPLVRAVEAERAGQETAGLGAVFEAEEAARLTEQATDDVAQVIGEAQDLMKGDLYVPRAFRDKLLQRVDAAIATSKLSANVADLNTYRNFWKQVVVLGGGFSRPIQFYMDTTSDLGRTFVFRGFKESAKAAARSLPSQALGIPGMALGMWTADSLRAAFGDAKFGDSARAFDRWVSNLVFASPVDDILRLSDTEVVAGVTGREAWVAARNAGVFENFASGQFTRSAAALGTDTGKGATLARGAMGAVEGAMAGAVVGGPMGAAAGAVAGEIFGFTPWGRTLIQKNWRYLQDAQNVAATRRRLAIYVGLLESGMAPEAAAAEAVKIVGDFSRELGPAERGFLGTLFPFWSYGKFSARSAAVALIEHPYRSGLIVKAGQGAGAGASLLIDMSVYGDDEFGFHPAAMSYEADPEVLEGIRQDIALEKGERWIAEYPGEWEALAQDRAENGWTDADGVAHARAPRAAERYERAVEKLRAMPYQDALDFFRSDGSADPELWRDLQTLSVYWAPSPQRWMLPSYAQTRPAVFVPKQRSQEKEGYFKSGTGRYEKIGDETRYFLLPQDPITEGITVPVLAGAAVLNLLDIGSDNTGSAFRELASGLFRDPMVAAAISQLDLQAPGAMEQLVPIPKDVGENLAQFEVLGVVQKQKLLRGQDPTSDGKDKYETLYYLPAGTVMALHLMKPFAGAPVAAMDAMAAKELLGGDASFVRGEGDAVDELGVYTSFFLGPKTYTFSPSTTASFDQKEVDARLERAVANMGKPREDNPPTRATVNAREMTRAAASPTFDAEAKEMLYRVKVGTPQGGDVPIARAVLMRSGMDPVEVAKMPDSAVLARVRTME